MSKRIDDKRAAEIAAAIRYDGSGRGILLRDLLADRAELLAEIERLKSEVEFLIGELQHEMYDKK